MQVQIFKWLVTNFDLVKYEECLNWKKEITALVIAFCAFSKYSSGVILLLTGAVDLLNIF